MKKVNVEAKSCKSKVKGFSYLFLLVLTLTSSGLKGDDEKNGAFYFKTSEKIIDAAIKEIKNEVDDYNISSDKKAIIKEALKNIKLDPMSEVRTRSGKELWLDYGPKSTDKKRTPFIEILRPVYTSYAAKGGKDFLFSVNELKELILTEIAHIWGDGNEAAEKFAQDTLGKDNLLIMEMYKLIEALSAENKHMKNILECGNELAKERALLEAIDANNIERVKYILSLGIKNIDKRHRVNVYDNLYNYDFETDLNFLELASFKGRAEIVALLADAGADVNSGYINDQITDGEYSPAGYAIKQGHLDVLKVLDEKGLKLSKTHLFSAVTNFHLDIVEFLRKEKNFSLELPDRNLMSAVLTKIISYEEFWMSNPKAIKMVQYLDLNGLSDEEVDISTLNKTRKLYSTLEN